jgi:hypothetical protein
MWSGPVARDEELQRKNKGKVIPGVAGDLEVQSFQLVAGGNGQIPSRHLSKLCCGGCWRKGLGARLLEKGSWMRGQKGGPRNALPVFYRGGSPLEMALMPYIFGSINILLFTHIQP